MNALYLLGSIGGVALLVGLNVMLFGFRAATIASASDAIRRLRDEIAGFRAGDAALDAAHHVALVEDARDGVLHLVVARGDGLATRALKHGVVKRLIRDGATLTLRLADFTLPRARITFADDDLAKLWEARLRAA